MTLAAPPQPVTVPEPVAEEKPKSKRATKDTFGKKKPRELEFDFWINDELVNVLMRAIGRKEYDAMLTACGPTVKQRAAGETYDQDTFAPKLLARVVIDPGMTEVDWRNTWNDDNWNRSELGELFFKAVDVCSTGVSADPTERG